MIQVFIVQFFSFVGESFMRKLSSFIPAVLLTLIFSIITGCGGGGNNNKPPSTTPPPPLTYTVTFNSNGGSAIQPATVNPGDTISEPATPTRTEYDFEGWFSNSGLTNLFSFSSPITGNITLYAKWIKTISNPSQLYDVRNNLAGDYRLKADISLAAYTNWVPIGKFGTPFTGKIDGNGYKITHLSINDTTEDYAGLFGAVNGGTITNLAMENVSIIGGVYTGAVAGYMENSIITDCYSTGSIASSSVVYAYSGGIVGYIYNSIIADSYSEGDIGSSSSSSISVHSGGIAGYMFAGTIKNSYSTGNITSYSEVLYEHSDPSPSSGGIAGTVYSGTITDSHSTGDIVSSFSSGGIAGFAWNSEITNSNSTGVISASNYSGGIAGVARENSTITDCYSTGNIASSATADPVPNYNTSYSGGIAGFTWKSAISNCYSTGNITSSPTSNSYSGGITGEILTGTITNCYSTGSVISTTSSSDSITFSGGIAGFALDSVISSCYSAANIISSLLASPAYAYSGGITGELVDSKVINCYSTGDVVSSSFPPSNSFTNQMPSGGITGIIRGDTALITSSYSTGNIYAGIQSIAGIAGYLDGGSITNCAAINKTINSADNYLVLPYVGRIVGQINYFVHISNNFALDAMEAPGTDFMPFENYRGIDKTDSELKERSTYENGLGWKFVDDGSGAAIWKMSDGGEYGYPILYWQ